MKRKARISLLLARAISRTPTGPLFDIEGGEGGGGGGAGDPPKTFTQADLDKIVGQRLADDRKKFADYDTIKAAAAKAVEFETELTKLREEKELEGKSAQEREKIAAEKAAKAFERERAESSAKYTAEVQARTAAEKRFQDMVVSNGLGSALDASKVLTAARDKAIVLMRAESTVELDDNGKVASVTYGGVAYKSAPEAAAAFLKDNDFLASAGANAGGGTKPPNAGGAPAHVDGSAESLLSMGLRARR